MLKLCLETLEMMGLTFVIGFLVAAVIKGIAIWADSLDYHHSRTDEMEHFTKLDLLWGKICEYFGLVIPEGVEKLDDERAQFADGVNKDKFYMKPPGYYHGVSHGASKLDLLNYYYPQDTRVVFMKKERQFNASHPTAEEKDNTSETK